MRKGKAKEIKRFCLGKCRKTEKIFTRNEIPQPKKINHVAAKWATAAIKQSMRSRTPNAITVKKKKINKKKRKKKKEGEYIYLLKWTCKTLSYSYDHPRYGRSRNRGAADRLDQIIIVHTFTTSDLRPNQARPGRNGRHSRTSKSTSTPWGTIIKH